MSLPFILLKTKNILHYFTASAPHCNTNAATSPILELDAITMTCSVNYTGNWAPQMRWQYDGGSSIAVGVVDKTVPNKSVTSSLTLVATRNITMNKFSCTTNLNANNRPQNSSANIPDKVYTCNSPMVEIVCKLFHLHLNKHKFISFYIWVARTEAILSLLRLHAIRISHAYSALFFVYPTHTLIS